MPCKVSALGAVSIDQCSSEKKDCTDCLADGTKLYNDRNARRGTINKADFVDGLVGRFRGRNGVGILDFSIFVERAQEVRVVRCEVIFPLRFGPAYVGCRDVCGRSVVRHCGSPFFPWPRYLSFSHSF